MLLDNSLHSLNPRNWSWFFYVWLVLIASSQIKPIWKWIQRNRANNWPLANGQIESVDVNKSKASSNPFSSNSGSSAYDALIEYSYSANGNAQSGIYKRVFSSEQEAWEFLRDLKDKSVAVHYNPNKPSASTLSEQSIETLLQSRSPKPAIDSFAPNPIPPFFTKFIWLFVALSAVGLVVSLWVHISAVAGRRVLPEEFFWILHVGIFVVWFPAMLVAKRTVGSTNRRDFWKVALKNAPAWMRYVLYTFFAYAAINFALFFYNIQTGRPAATPEPMEWRGFSGHWMIFYFAAFAILYSAAIGQKSIRRCANGHAIPANANFCTQCGQPVAQF